MLKINFCKIFSVLIRYIILSYFYQTIIIIFMPSLGKDLAIIRAHLGYSIEDIHSATKIPLNTLKSIESGAIFEQTDEIKTYVRSFVRTYGRFLKLDEQLLLDSLDLQQANMYDNLLLTAFPELNKGQKSKTTDDKEAKPEEKSAKSESNEEKKDTEQEVKASTRFVADFSDDDDSEEESHTEKKDEVQFKPAPPPGVRSINWADTGRKLVTNRQKTPVWVIGSIVILLVLFVSIYYFVRNDVFQADIDPAGQTSPTEQAIPAPTNGNDLTLDITEPAETEEPAVLDGTLYLTVYAANERLDPVRVWSDLKPRIDPYWMERGLALNFEFRDTIRVRGQYNNMLLFMNGHLIQNFRQEYFNAEESAVEITRDIFEADPRWATQVPFELPPNVSEPDSVANRPSF